MDNRVEENFVIFYVDGSSDIRYLTDYHNPQSNIKFPYLLEEELKRRLDMLLSLKDELISQVSNTNKSP